MIYRVRLKKKAEEELEHLPADTAKRVIEKLRNLGKNPFRADSVKLRMVEGYRLRVGNYRVLYTIDKKAKRIYVYRIKHRREAYR